MSRATRVALLVGAVVIAVGAFFVLQPGADEEPSREASAPTSTETVVPDGEATTTQEAQEPAPAPKPEVNRIRVKGGQPVGGEAKVNARKGETIRLAVNSDVADEVHVHGYDLSKPVGPGQPVWMQFKANLEGIFEIELEETAVPIAQLEVRP